MRYIATILVCLGTVTLVTLFVKGVVGIFFELSLTEKVVFFAILSVAVGLFLKGCE